MLNTNTRDRNLMILDFVNTRSIRNERTSTKRIANSFAITFMEARERLRELQSAGMLNVDADGWFSINAVVKEPDEDTGTRKRKRLTYGQVFLGANQTRKGY